MRPVLAAACLLFLAGFADATPEHDVRFLGKEPHGPLAVAHGKKLASPEGSACRTWGRRGSVWNALDALGRVVGRASVSGMERYDVTNCDELVMKTISGKDGAGVYAADGYQALALERWVVAGKARRELEAMIRTRDATLPKVSQKVRDPQLDQRMLAWKTPSGARFAAVGGRGLTVLRREATAWVVLHRITPRTGEVAHADMYMPLSALDMNGDGSVEVVVHARWIDAYEDFTLTPKRGGYEEVSAGIHGAFA